MFDAIIVLANLMDIEGNLNDESAARLAEASRLWHGGAGDILVPCGWAYRPDSDIRIADAMKSHAVDRHGIPSDKIMTETTSRDTVGDAVFTKLNIANPRGWKNVAVVTSDYHAARTEAIFSFVYGKPVKCFSALSGKTDELILSEARSLEAFRKTFLGVSPGDDEAILDRLATDHPFYNGDIHPAITADARQGFRDRSNRAQM